MPSSSFRTRPRSSPAPPAATSSEGRSGRRQPSAPQLSPRRASGPSLDSLMEVAPSSPPVQSQRRARQPETPAERSGHIDAAQDQPPAAQDQRPSIGATSSEYAESKLHRLASQSQWHELETILLRYLDLVTPSLAKSSGAITHDTHTTHRTEETNPNTPSAAAPVAARKPYKSGPQSGIDEEHPSTATEDEIDDDMDESDYDSTRQSVQNELCTPQGSSASLPLHLASANGAPASMLHMLVQAYPPAALQGDEKGDLPIHLLRRYAENEATKRRVPMHQIVDVESIEILLRPLCFKLDTVQPRRSDNKGILDPAVAAAGQKVERLFKLRPETEDDLTAAVQAAKRVLTSDGATALASTASSADTDRDDVTAACELPSSFSAHLPIHIASEFGVSYDTLLGLCQSNLSMASTPLGPQSPLELFEDGRAGKEIQEAQKTKRRSERVVESATFGLGGKSGLSTPADYDGLMESYHRRSDLLFAFNPDADPSSLRMSQQDEESATRGIRGSSSRKSGSKPKARRNRSCRSAIPYRQDMARISRIEDLIRAEALDIDKCSLSSPSEKLWDWICQHSPSASADRRDNYIGVVGRILDGLQPKALWKLSLVSSPKPRLLVLGNGRTIPEEAAMRRPFASFDQLLRSSQYGWQLGITSFLNATDALSYTVVCRRTHRGGVRLLREMDLKEHDGEFTFETSIDGGLLDSPLPWQDLTQSLITPDCTHTVFVEYELEVSDGFDPGRGGGLVVVCEDLASDIRQDSWQDPPVGHGVVAREQRPTSRVGLIPDAMNDVRLSFRYEPGARTRYSLYSYGTMNNVGVACVVSVSNVRIRQLVYCEDNEGMTPLHVYLSSHPEGNHVPGNIALRRQVGTLLAAGFGTIGIVPLHYALKVNSSEKLVRALIAEDSSALLETDREGRTPLHAAFLLSRAEPPSEGVVKALLITPGENAAKVKDSHARLPLHIAAERGASLSILKLLVNIYPDSCYRVNSAGDLPVHLLVRSGSATSESVELLIEPIMHNETICKLGGSVGCQLPLHIAAEYCCSFKVLESLLSTYGEAANTPRTLPPATKEAGDIDAYENMYAIDLFELSRVLESSGVGSSHRSRPQNKRSSFIMNALSSKDSASSDGHTGSGSANQDVIVEDISPVKTPLSNSTGKARRRGSFGAMSKSVDTSSLFESGTVHSRDLAVNDMLSADFDLRSDLIFVYAPLLDAPGGPYRTDRRRIKRLTNLIRREAIQIAEKHGGDPDSSRSTCAEELTEMARLAWRFLCTYHDCYVSEVRAILRGLSTPAVSILASVPDPHSRPGMTITDCASPKCKELIQSRLRFVGRYVLDGNAYPVHKSDSCMVIRAKDYSCVEEYKKVQDILSRPSDFDDTTRELHEKFEQSVTEDDIGTIIHHASSGACPSKDLVDAFVSFATKAGVDEEHASAEINALIGHAVDYHASEVGDTVSELGDNDHPMDASSSTKSANSHGNDAHRRAFDEFSKAYGFNNDGTRSVCIKFMHHRSQFEREVWTRSRLDVTGGEWPIAPILEDFDADRIKNSTRRASTLSPLRSPAASGEYSDYRLPTKECDSNQGSDSKDELFALHIVEKNATVPSFSLFRYAIVMPAGDRDLDEISRHEELSIVQIREYTLQVALALQRLHEKSYIHGDLKPANVVRFGERLALVDLDSACSIGSSEQGQVEHLGGSYHKFSTGILPPEMIFKLDLQSDRHLLEDYQEYFRDIVNDSKDLKLLNPDDVNTISRCIKTLLGRSDVARNMGSTVTSLRTSMGEPLANLKDPGSEWREALSDALISIDFENLPQSLSSCETLHEFSAAWDRLNSSASLWDKFCPRQSMDGRFAYILKIFDERPSRADIEAEDINLPYDLVPAEAHVDIWALGLLLYSLCSGGSLFHVGHNGDLRSFSAYAADLNGWTKESAASIALSNVDDPLAQDLLTKLLVPERYRYKSMEKVLQHPFFGDHASLEAQQILERHEEQQLLTEETFVFTQMVMASRRRLALGVEKQNRIIFEKDRLVVPTAIVVLPYELQIADDDNWPSGLRGDEAGKPFISGTDHQSLETAAFIGLNLLEINLATARLAFWLTMRKSLASNNSREFKSRLKAWLKRARTEPCVDVAEDILSTIGLGPQFLGVCKEVLEKGDATSHARAYIKNPMGAAKEALDRSSNALLQCYSSQYVYLLDEFYGTPTIFNPNDDDDEQDQTTYPLQVDPSANLFQPLLLQFMIVASMASLARDKFQGLARMLGMPPSSDVPEEWLRYKDFLIHRVSKSSTITEFGVLQDCIRKKEHRAVSRKLQAIEDGGSTSGMSHPTISTTSSIDDDNEKGFLMLQLETFFREYDASRTFSGLHRVSDGREYNGSAMWVSGGAVELLESQVEVAITQQRVRQLKREQDRLNAMQQDMEPLMVTGGEQNSNESFGQQNTETPVGVRQETSIKPSLEPQLSGFMVLGDLTQHRPHRPPSPDEYGVLNDEFEEEEETLTPHAFGSLYVSPWVHAMEHNQSAVSATPSIENRKTDSLGGGFDDGVRAQCRQGSMGHLSAGRYSYPRQGSCQVSIGSSVMSDRRKKMRNTAKSQPKMRIHSVRSLFSKSGRNLGGKEPNANLVLRVNMDGKEFV